MDVLTNLVAIILQYICVSNPQVVLLELVYVNYISIKLEEKISSNLGFKSRLSDVASAACGSWMSQRLLAFGLEGVESDI